MLAQARWLLCATVVYNVVEGVIAIWSGIAAGSLALVAFGADSYIEVAAASVVLWRLSIAEPERAEEAEQRATRFIGLTFMILAAAVVFEATWAFAQENGASESLVGLGVALASVTVMPGIAMWKLRVATQGDIPVLAAEAKETLACSYLSITLLIGLVATVLFHWWWLDSLTALLLTPWLIREGLEGIRGEESKKGAETAS
jgi:divalent metal cation (Fe/Co/Zn/Cd) transporter